jgi:hypothetical protein
VIREQPPRTARLSEVADALAEHGHLLCCPTVRMEEGVATLTVAIPVQELSDLELYERLRRVQDLATARALATRYGIPPERLEPFITGGD